MAAVAPVDRAELMNPANVSDRLKRKHFRHVKERAIEAVLFLAASLSVFTTVAIVYILANIAVCVHLFHGMWSVFQSLGLNNPRYNNIRRGIAYGISGLLLVGNVSFPIMIWAGVVS
jgi:ABC-type phosphate transport system permease subunit